MASDPTEDPIPRKEGSGGIDMEPRGPERFSSETVPILPWTDPPHLKTTESGRTPEEKTVVDFARSEGVKVASHQVQGDNLR